MGWTKTATSGRKLNSVRKTYGGSAFALGCVLVAVLILGTSAVGGLIIWAGFAIIVPQWGVTFWMTWIGWTVLTMIVGMLRGNNK